MDSYILDNIVVTCSSGGSIYFWNCDTYSLLGKYNINNTKFTEIKCSPVSNILAVGSENGVIRIYDTENVKYSPDSEWNTQLVNKYKEFRKSHLIMKMKRNHQMMIQIQINLNILMKMIIIQI